MDLAARASEFLDARLAQASDGKVVKKHHDELSKFAL